ncbi:TPA: CDP-glycerol glycerophosphotransferase family protein, partial [Escherichia coli]|nr:CDP-glycerol glycerophosphotransferase family protein [Escherichia coli]
MKIKKIKKLFKNPKSFIADSRYFNFINSKKKVDNKLEIGFIVISQNHDLSRYSIDSIIQANNAASKSFPYIVIHDYDEKCGTETIHTIVKKLDTPYIKILFDGEKIHRDFIIKFLNHNIDPNNNDIILHAFSTNSNVKQVDGLLSSSKDISFNNQLWKEHAVLLFSTLIIKSDLILNTSKILHHGGRIIDSLNVLRIFRECEEMDYVLYLNDMYSFNSASLKLEEKIKVLMEDELLLKITFAEIFEHVSLGGRNVFYRKTLFYFIHNIVLFLLKNKKTDERLHEETKTLIKNQLTDIIRILGVDILKGFSAKNYNHVHKIGYLKLIGVKADKDLCYIEDINSENKVVKVKIASQTDAYPQILLNKEYLIPFTAKVKDLTIFDVNFSHEIYFWFSYDAISQELVIKKENNTEILSGGKHYKKIKIENIIKNFERRDLINSSLPLMSKILRYLHTVSFFQKKFLNAWVFIDNEIRADDNAEHFYRYISQKHPDINIYFLLSKKSVDWERLKKAGFKLVKFGGFYHRLLLLNARYLLSSHANPAIVNYLPKKYYADLMKYKFVFLQHGITKDDQSEWLNSRKIDYLVTASKFEHDDISRRGRYRYTTKEVVLTGFPRFDNLSNVDTRNNQILIMPTWRKELAGELMKKSSKRIKNKDFANSLFCKMWGGVLRSESLYNAYKKKGYTIIFYPHPNLADYISDLNIPDYVKIGSLENESIQSIFKKTNLLITDYSSVAFDIAYMKTPVIYFQFDSDTFFSNHSYSKGYFDYNDFGFGPVVKNINDLSEQLNLIVDNNCNLTDFYMSRIKSFFPFSDNNNSSRLYKVLSVGVNKKHDLETLYNYLLMFTSIIDIEGIALMLNNYKQQLQKILYKEGCDICVVINCLYLIANVIDEPKLNLAIRNLLDGVELTNGALKKNHSFGMNNGVDSRISYIEDQIETLSTIIDTNSKLLRHLIDLHAFLTFFKNEEYVQAVFSFKHLQNNLKLRIDGRIVYIYVLSLLRDRQIKEAMDIAKKLSLSDENKEELLIELVRFDNVKNIKSIDIDFLLPSKNDETLLKLYYNVKQSIPENIVKRYSHIDDMPYFVFEFYLDELLSKKEFEGYYEYLNNSKNKVQYLDNNINKYKYI